MKTIITILVSASLVFSFYTNYKTIDDIEVKTEITEKLEDNDLYTLREVYTIQDYLGYDFSNIDLKKLKGIEKKLRLANQVYKKDEYESEQYLRLKSEAYQMIRAEGYDVPLHSLYDAAEVLRGDISKYEYKLLLYLSTRSTKTKVESEMLFDSVIADFIISKYGISANELFLQSSFNGMQLALYNVNDMKIERNNLDTVIDKTDKHSIEKEHQRIWNRIVEIIPKKYLELVDRFEIITDGKEEITGFVETANNRWSLSVDPKDTIDGNGNFTPYSMKTIIHESAHIISLNKSQMTSDNNGSLYVVREGTLKKDSYLNVFFHRFWESLANSNEESDGYDNMSEYYNKHKSEFVSKYASRDPSEDFAESFAYFVLRPKPTGSLLKDKKVLFFYEYPEFVEIRDHVRDVIKNKK